PRRHGAAEAELAQATRPHRVAAPLEKGDGGSQAVGQARRSGRLDWYVGGGCQGEFRNDTTSGYGGIEENRSSQEPLSSNPRKDPRRADARTRRAAGRRNRSR